MPRNEGDVVAAGNFLFTVVLCSRCFACCCSTRAISRAVVLCSRCFTSCPSPTCCPTAPESHRARNPALHGGTKRTPCPSFPTAIPQVITRFTCLECGRRHHPRHAVHEQRMLQPRRPNSDMWSGFYMERRHQHYQFIRSKPSHAAIVRLTTQYITISFCVAWPHATQILLLQRWGIHRRQCAWHHH
jgi:hypothetical protein